MLDGVQLSKKKCMRLLGMDPKKDDISTVVHKTFIHHVDVDNRIVTNRSVKMVKTDMRVNVIRGTISSYSFFQRACMCMSALVSFAVIFYWTALLFRTDGACHCQLPVFLSSRILPDVSREESCALNLTSSLVIFTLSVLPFLLFVKKKKVKHIAYVPHLVSSVVSEYDHGTNKTVLDSTVRQRIMRLAALPIPDFDHLTLVDGSEMVIKFLVSRQPSFSSIPGLLRV